ncbi:hypothetical protein BDN71DRAFT_1508475 [Pleurotus eryngii]|uniref:Uncharacterized protein n=1 Tax=Pleurotus eryngii TaxID=5323 RepID=A0A9P6DER1_PLEER|nr:hypothetical protein BDN71DRAFT_1508475 [Pleurotus eryngii]
MSEYIHSTPQFSVPQPLDDDNVSMSGSSVHSVYMDAPTDFDDTSTHSSITPTATPTPFASMNPYATYDAIADYEMGSALHRQSITSDVHMPSQSVTPVDVSMTSQSATPMIVSPVIMSTDSSVPFMQNMAPYAPYYNTPAFNPADGANISFSNAANTAPYHASQHNVLLTMGNAANTAPHHSSHYNILSAMGGGGMLASSDDGTSHMGNVHHTGNSIRGLHVSHSMPSIANGDTLSTLGYYNTVDRASSFSGLFPTSKNGELTSQATSDLAFLGAMVDTSFTFDPTLNGDFTMPEASSINAEVARYLFNELPGITSEWPAPLAAPKPRYHAQFTGTTKGTVGAVSGVKRKRPTVTVNETDDPVRRKRQGTAPKEPSDTLDVAPASPSAPTPACPSATSAPALPSTPSHTPATPAPTLPSVATSLHLPDPAAEGPAPQPLPMDTSVNSPMPTLPSVAMSSQQPDPAAEGPAPQPLPMDTSVNSPTPTLHSVATSSAPQPLPMDTSVGSLVAKPKRGSQAKGAKLKQTETLSSLHAQVAELKKAYNEAQSADTAITTSFAQVLERETNLHHLLSTRDKELADLRGRGLDGENAQQQIADLQQKYDGLRTQSQDLQEKEAKYTADIARLREELAKLQSDAQGSLDEVTQLRMKLSTVEESGRDEAEAAEVQYSELQDRFEGQLHELSQAVDTIHQHQQTVNRLTLELETSRSTHSKLLECFEALERNSVKDSQQLVNELQHRISDLESAYEKLGQDARFRYQALKDDHEVQLCALREGMSGDIEAAAARDLEKRMASLRKKYDEDTAAHQIVIQELRARIKDLEHAYQQLGEDTQSRYQALKDDHKAQLHTLREQGSSRDAQLERVKDLEAQLTTLKAKSDRDLNDAQMQLEGLHQIQQHATEDALTQYNQLQQATEDARRREAEAIRSEDIQRQVATELQARYAQLQETHVQAIQECEDRYQATTHDHTLRVTELQRELQEALCQLTEASEARYQRLVEESRQPGEIQAAISTAIADARRAAEDHFQTRTTEIQRENHELHTEISNLRATVEQLPVRQENMNANADKGKQRVVLNVHSYG